jgi:hypothetical protein
MYSVLDSKICSYNNRDKHINNGFDSTVKYVGTIIEINIIMVLIVPTVQLCFIIVTVYMSLKR